MNIYKNTNIPCERFIEEVETVDLYYTITQKQLRKLTFNMRKAYKMSNTNWTCKNNERAEVDRNLNVKDSI